MPSKSLNRFGRLCYRHSTPFYLVVPSATTLPIRTLTTTPKHAVDVAHTPPSPVDPPPPSSSNPPDTLTPKQHALLTPVDPNTASEPRLERILMRQGNSPVGSRRRRAALRTSPNIPFEKLPYQCFQEARKVLLEDREEKLAQITTQRARIERLKLQDVGHSRSALLFKEKSLLSMMRRLEKLKVLADVNDPLVKKRFEDGEGDMDRPIYRHLAKQKWLGRRYLILKQRLSQMHVYPDLLPPFDITYDVELAFGRKDIAPGEFVHSAMSERAPKLTIQPFDKGKRLVTIAVVDPDVPDVEGDTFSKRCHFLATNVPIGPTNTKVNMQELMGAIEMEKSVGDQASYESRGVETTLTQAPRTGGDVLLPWLPPYAQKGSPYHRLCVIVLVQYRPLDANAMREVGKYGRERREVSVTAMMSRFHLRPLGGFLFRTQWDSGMDALMERLGVEGVGQELKRKRVEPLPYKWKPSMSERYR